jgi:hypothetical protein
LNGAVRISWRIEPVLHPSSPIAIHRREAGDSFDFNVRHGRALQAQAARECIDLLWSLFGWTRRRGATRRPPWQVVWPVAEPSACDRS